MAVTMASVDLAALNRRFVSLQMRLSALQGQAHELTSRQVRLTRDVSLAKARLELAPQAMAAFEYLQEKAHARAVGQFEDLLSAFVQDVLPNEGNVLLELGTERGAPALNIVLSNGGDLEDIYSANGGGITNVVVTALAFSALSRTTNRQLMLLDEPDCWLKSINVPAFTKVIAEVSNPQEADDGSWTPGCQTLMVSHNDISLMDEAAHIQDVRVEYDLQKYADRMGVPVRYVGDVTGSAYVVWVPAEDGKHHIEVRYRPEPLGDDENNALTKGFSCIDSISGARPWDESMEGVRWIEVENMRRHVKARLELSCGLNVLTGGVNSGKSTLLYTAARALAYGESDESLIRHGADAAVVRMQLENKVMLEMVRNRKATPKVVYRRYVDGVLENEASQEKRGSVPKFIREALRIERVDDMDIQLRHQKEPVFLLNESPARRARLLSVGKESGLLQSMIEKHRLSVRRDREQIKREEVELNEVNRTLKALSPLASLSGLTEILTGMIAEAQIAGEHQKAAKQLVARLTGTHGKARLGLRVLDKLDTLPGRPSLEDTQGLVGAITRLAANKGKAQLRDMPEAPVLPSLASTAQLMTTIDRISANVGKSSLPDMVSVPACTTLTDASLLQSLIGRIDSGRTVELLSVLGPVPVPPSLTDTAAIRTMGVKLARGVETVRKMTKDEATATQAQSEAVAALAKLQAELGVCPLCNHAFEEHPHD